MIMTVDPGQQLTLPRLPAPAIFLVIEGSGDTLESGYAPPIILRPGRAYYMPPDVDPPTFKVGGAQKGPLKVRGVCVRGVMMRKKKKNLFNNNNHKNRSARRRRCWQKRVLLLPAAGPTRTPCLLLSRARSSASVHPRTYSLTYSLSHALPLRVLAWPGVHLGCGRALCQVAIAHENLRRRTLPGQDKVADPYA